MTSSTNKFKSVRSLNGPSGFERLAGGFVGYAVALKSGGSEIIVLAPTLDKAESAGEAIGGYAMDRRLISKAALIGGSTLDKLEAERTTGANSSTSIAMVVDRDTPSIERRVVDHDLAGRPIYVDQVRAPAAAAPTAPLVSEVQAGLVTLIHRLPVLPRERRAMSASEYDQYRAGHHDACHAAAKMVKGFVHLELEHLRRQLAKAERIIAEMNPGIDGDAQLVAGEVSK